MSTKLKPDALEREMNEHVAEVLDELEDEVEAAFQRVARKFFMSVDEMRELYLTTREAESFGFEGVMQ